MRLAQHANSVEDKIEFLKQAYAWSELVVQHRHAQASRLLASELKDPETKAASLRIAEDYDRLVLRAAERLRMEKPRK
jgi:hypothetical protein